MRMLVLLLLAINVAIAAYYLTVGAGGNTAPAPPEPGRGTLELVSETRGASRASDPRSPATRCWQREFAKSGQELDAVLGALREDGYRTEAVSESGGGYTVRLASAETIHQAAQALESLEEAGVEGLRVRPTGDNGLYIVSGRFASRAEARRRAAALRGQGFDAAVVGSENGRDHVRVVVSAPADLGTPGPGWKPLDCQPEQP